MCAVCRLTGSLALRRERQPAASDRRRQSGRRRSDHLDVQHSQLLDKLGWTKDDARRFLDRWEQMRRAAEQKGPDGEQAKRQFDEALKSLGLGHGTELKHGGIEADSPETQRDAGRPAPAPNWANHLRVYTRGVAGKEPKK